jgi:PTS system nitrogen regulatory IIA component
MKGEILTIKEISEYLQTSERTIYSWIQNGEIPCAKFGNTWRFKKKDIENWANEKFHNSSQLKDKISNLKLQKILSKDKIVIVDSINKREMLLLLCEKISDSHLVTDNELLKAKLFEREEMMSTGIGLGIGIPHVKAHCVKDIIMAAGLARKPIADYDSLDGIPVQMVFLIAANFNQHHGYLKILSDLSSFLKNEKIRNNILKSNNVEEFYKILIGE